MHPGSKRAEVLSTMRLVPVLVVSLLIADEAARRFPTSIAAASPQPVFAAPVWAFPMQVPPPADPFPTADSVRLHRIPGIERRFTQKAAFNRFAPADWLPQMHPPAPPPVATGRRPAAIACAFCHLYNGAGRPENATLAGLPVEYIVRQVRAFRDSTRLAANPASRTNSMHGIARAFTVAEVEQAAAYFARLQLTRRNRVVETMHVPRHRVAGTLYARDGEGTEPIGGRLIEMPEDFARHELHDPTVRYVTYVPPGSLARGRHLAQAGPSGIATACITCHGPALSGVANVPPIAGRSPQYLLRQLINLRTGARADTGSAPMLAIVQALSLRDMVAVAAYAGSLAPSPP
jgi:Cytochrome c553